jgi:hypothetical protein
MKKVLLALMTFAIAAMSYAQYTGVSASPDGIAWNFATDTIYIHNNDTVDGTFLGDSGVCFGLTNLTPWSNAAANVPYDYKSYMNTLLTGDNVYVSTAINSNPLCKRNMGSWWRFTCLVPASGQYRKIVGWRDATYTDAVNVKFYSNTPTMDFSTPDASFTLNDIFNNTNYVRGDRRSNTGAVAIGAATSSWYTSTTSDMVNLTAGTYVVEIELTGTGNGCFGSLGLLMEVPSNSKNVNITNINVYPTITEDILKIASENAIASVEVYNMLGSKVANFNNVNNTINISNLNNGIYFVNVKTVNNQVSTVRVVKQ